MNIVLALLIVVLLVIFFPIGAGVLKSFLLFAAVVAVIVLVFRLLSDHPPHV